MTETTVSGAMQPVAHRLIPSRVRADLIAQRVDYQSTPSWVIKDPVSLKYHRLTETHYFILQQLDGTVTLEELKIRLQRHRPQIHWTYTEIQRLITDLHKNRLVYSDRLGQGRTFWVDQRQQFWKKTRSVAMNFLFIRFPGWEPSRLLDVLYPLDRWMFHPVVIAALSLFIAGSWFWTAAHFDAFQRELPSFSQFFAWPNILYLWVILALTKILHEFGHALTCRHFGGECHEIGVMLLIFSPTLYCDVTDSWMMRNKWHRIWIAGAGMFVELVISALALVVWWNTKEGLAHQLALNVFFVTSITTIVFNANPLIKFDGYYMFADFLEVPNLREKSGKAMREWFGSYCLGIEPQPDPFDPIQSRGWFVLYAVAAAVYRCILTVTIGLMLYQMLKPYRLESIGAALAIASVAGLIGQTVWQVIQMIRAPRETPLSRPRIIVTLLMMAAILVGIAFVPVPIYIEAPFTVQPRGVVHVYSSHPGLVAEIHSQAGSQVQKDDLIFQLVNEEKQDKLLELQEELQVQQAKVKTYHALGSSAEKAMAEQHVASLQEQIQELKTELAQLEIRSPIGGRVIAPPTRPEPDRTSTDGRLPGWSGTPLDPENLGGFIEEQTHLCSIAPGEEMEAVLLIDQLDRNELSPGTTIRLKIDHLPAVVHDGVIREISRRHQEFAPPQLSNKSGGTLPTVSEDSGAERLTSIVYEATVDVDLPAELSLSGNRGRARLLLSHKPLAYWAYRWLRRTLYFRL